MKLNFRTRIVVGVGALLVALIGIGMAVMGLQFRVIDLQSTLALRLLLLGLGLFLVTYAAYILLLPRRIKKTQENFMVQQTASGELRISMKAIESIVKKCVDTAPDVKPVELMVNHTRGTVRVDLRVSMPGNVSIPLAAENLQKQIKKQIQAAAGIDTTEVRISVETSDNAAQASPYQLEKTAEKKQTENQSEPMEEALQTAEGMEENGAE